MPEALTKDFTHMVADAVARKDWCHGCGKRSFGHANVWFPEDAENKVIGEPRFFRICEGCARRVLEEAIRAREAGNLLEAFGDGELECPK